MPPRVCGIGFHIGSLMADSAPFVAATEPVVALVSGSSARASRSRTSIWAWLGFATRPKKRPHRRRFRARRAGCLARARRPFLLDPGRSLVARRLAAHASGIRQDRGSKLLVAFARTTSSDPAVHSCTRSRVRPRIRRRAGYTSSVPFARARTSLSPKLRLAVRGRLLAICHRPTAWPEFKLQYAPRGEVMVRATSCR